MMKKIVIFTFLVVLVIAFTGCTETTTKPKAKDSGNGETPSEETIQQILAKAKEPKNMECELVMTRNGTPIESNMKVYLKGEKYVSEIKTGDVLVKQIYDGKKVYTYSPVYSEFYCESDFPSYASPSDSMGFEYMAEKALEDPNLKEFGKETIDGIKTRVIEFSYEDFAKHQVKAWISEEHGIVIKSEDKKELLSGQGSYTEVQELKNIKFNSVQDSMFEVPADKIKPLEEC
ncbi:MAG: hypothetical protein ABH986_03780 [archaeon]